MLITQKKAPCLSSLPFEQPADMSQRGAKACPACASSYLVDFCGMIESQRRRPLLELLTLISPAVPAGTTTGRRTTNYRCSACKSSSQLLGCKRYPASLCPLSHSAGVQRLQWEQITETL